MDVDGDGMPTHWEDMGSPRHYVPLFVLNAGLQDELGGKLLKLLCH